jgi:hypothetical protein
MLATKAQRVMSSAVLTCLIGAGRVSFCAEDDQALDAHVRSSSQIIAALIQSASEQSKTFKGLIDTINQSDGIVFVEEGTCGHGVPACFVTVTKAGPDRILWVKVDTTRTSDLDLKAQIGHELRHTIEVLGDRSVTNQIAMYFFYSQIGPVRSGSRFETTDAIETGEAIRLEVAAFNRRLGHR